MPASNEIDPTFLALPYKRLGQVALERARDFGVSHADFRFERNRYQFFSVRDGALEGAQGSLRATIRTMADNAYGLSAASEEMSVTAGAIAASAEETSAQSGVVSAAAEEVSRNVQTVATGAEQMGASIREISQNANEAARVGSSAVGVAEATNATVTRLGESSKEIGDVVVEEFSEDAYSSVHTAGERLKKAVARKFEKLVDRHHHHAPTN